MRGWLTGPARCVFMRRHALQEVFAQFDVDNSGQLDRRELARLLQTLMPDLNQT